MTKDLIINFLTRDMHIQKEPIDYDYLYELAESGVYTIKDMKLTPKNHEKLVRKLKYIDSLHLTAFDEFHQVDEYSLTLLRSKYGLLPKLKNKMLFNNKMYKFIFNYYKYKHGIDYDEFVIIDKDNQRVAEELDINISLVLQKRTKTLEELSFEYNCTRESIRLRIIEAKKFITTRYVLPELDYVLEQDFDQLDYISKIILLSYHDLIWQDKFKAYVIDGVILSKIRRFGAEVSKLKDNYFYPIATLNSSIEVLILNYVDNDSNLYIEKNKVYSLIKNGEHHNANFILNYLKDTNITHFYIEDLLHDDFLATNHGKLMSESITTSLRNLEAILDREDILVKVDTHQYMLEKSIQNIDFIDKNDIFLRLTEAPDVVNLELLKTLFAEEIEMLNIAPKGFYYLLKKYYFDKFKFRKLVIYNSDYKLQTKFEILAKDFDNQKVIQLDESLLSNATNLARKFKEKGGLIYGDKLYNTNLLKLTKQLKAVEIKPDFDKVIFRSTFNNQIENIILDEIDFKRKFAFKLWTHIHELEYFNFYARFDSKYPELHTLVYCINEKKQKISYTTFIDTIEQISGSRKVYQILQNMIDSGIVDCDEKDPNNKQIIFKPDFIKYGVQKHIPTRPNALEVYSKLEDIKLTELRQLAKRIHIKNIGKYKKKELISILRNTVKVTEIYDED